jgi:pyruvate dehydrogenase E1 component alpha subunit
MAGKKKDVSASSTPKQGFSLISNEKLLQLYAAMVKCRKLAEQARLLMLQSQLTVDAVCSEAVAVGAAIDLLPEDTVVALCHDFMVELILGAPLEEIIGRLPVRAAGPDPAEQLSRAIAAAHENKAKKNGKIAVAFLGDESTASGSMREAFEVANAQQLPILFICQRNLKAVQETLDAQPYGFPILTVDGSDVVAVYRVATESIAHARMGNGPTLIECCFDRSTAHDPIQKMEAYLAGKGLFHQHLSS